jgi:NAD(P)H-hydrate repair Nnr-like enzyme with NAD(P)H-hydrate dehydratase domain
MLMATSPNYRGCMDDLFGPEQAARWIAVPGPDDDKYARGVVGFVTGSVLHTGVGMVRYLGPGRPTRLVLQRRPEAVTADGRVQAWVLGSGQDAAHRDEPTAARLEAALGQPVPVVVDAGALDLHARAAGPVLLTPHAGELAKAVGARVEDVRADPPAAAREAAAALGATVLLKGHTTHVATPDGGLLRVRSAPSWLATAGAGDALAGILGALLATHADRIAEDPGVIAPLAATGAVLHGLAAERASGGGPLTVLDLAAELPRVIADLLAA